MKKKKTNRSVFPFLLRALFLDSDFDADLRIRFSVKFDDEIGIFFFFEFLGERKDSGGFWTRSVRRYLGLSGGVSMAEASVEKKSSVFVVY